MSLPPPPLNPKKKTSVFITIAPKLPPNRNSKPPKPPSTSIFIFVVTAISRRRATPKMQAKPLLSSAKYLAKTARPSHPTPLPCLQRKPKICKKENPNQLSPRRCQNHVVAPPLKPPPNTRFPSPVRTPKP